MRSTPTSRGRGDVDFGFNFFNRWLAFVLKGICSQDASYDSQIDSGLRERETTVRKIENVQVNLIGSGKFGFSRRVKFGFRRRVWANWSSYTYSHSYNSLNHANQPIAWNCPWPELKAHFTHFLDSSGSASDSSEQRLTTEEAGEDLDSYRLRNQQLSYRLMNSN